MISTEPLVSIIIPTKERYEWLRDCLQSVLDQDYPEIEIIVVDDGSTLPVIGFITDIWKIPTSHISVIRNVDSVGPGQSREIGRLRARGTYISYVDSDDVMLPRKIRNQVNFLLAHPDYGMCYCRSKVFRALPITGHENLYREVDFKDGDILPQLLINRPWGTGACLWSKEATDSIGPWSTLQAGEDQEYEFRAGLLGIKVHQIPEVLFYIRRSTEQPQLNQQSSICRLEDAKMYISVGEQAYQALDSVDANTLFIICRHLVFSTIFVLLQRDKQLAVQSLKTIKQLVINSKLAQIVIELLRFVIYLLPAGLAGKIIHLFRHRIVNIFKQAVQSA